MSGADGLASSLRPCLRTHKTSAPPCRGIVSVLPTPCSSPGEIDPHALKRLCSLLSGKGCDGIFIAGSSGELPLLDGSDLRVMTAAAREGIPSDTRLYVGTTGCGPKQTVRHAAHAAEDGANVAVVMVPAMLKYSQVELRHYFWQIAEESPIPVAVYHHLRMPSTLAVETIAELAQHPNVVAIKDTSVDLERLQALILATAATGTILLQGSERLIHDSLLAGAGGCMSALASVAPEWHVALYQAWRRNDQPGAQHWQTRINALGRFFEHRLLRKSFSNFAHFLKRALHQRGWLENTASTMVGFQPDPEFERTIAAHLHSVGLDGDTADGLSAPDTAHDSTT